MSDHSNLQIILSSDAPRVEIGLPIKLSVTVENVGDEPITLFRRINAFAHLIVRVFTADGEELHNRQLDVRVMFAPPRGLSDYVILDPRRFYGIRDLTWGRSITLDKPGAYRLRVDLDIPDYSDRSHVKAWSGSARSNTIQITVE